MKIITLFTLLMLSVFNLSAQEVPEHISNTGIYDFLDEIASQHIITINSVVKPYARIFIAQKLQEASLNKAKLNDNCISWIFICVHIASKQAIIRNANRTLIFTEKKAYPSPCCHQVFSIRTAYLLYRLSRCLDMKLIQTAMAISIIPGVASTLRLILGNTGQSIQTSGIITRMS